MEEEIDRAAPRFDVFCVSSQRNQMVSRQPLKIKANSIKKDVSNRFREGEIFAKNCGICCKAGAFPFRFIFCRIRPHLENGMMPSFDFQFSPRENTNLTSCDFASLGACGPLDLVLRREFYAAGDTTGTHLHLDFCALYVVNSGRGAHQIDGIPFGIARGDVYLLPPGARHAYTGYQNLEIDAFYFPLGLWSDEELGALREVSGFWHLLLKNEARRLHLQPEMHTQIEVFIAEIRAEATKNERATPLLLRALLFRLLVKLARAALGEAAREWRPDAARSGEAQFAELITWCEANVEREISVAQMAGRLFLSTAHFARGWKREFGVPPATYLRSLKLERARALLENSNQSMAHIAREVGFKSAAHFSRSFRICYGVSPLQFRRDAALKR